MKGNLRCTANYILLLKTKKNQKGKTRNCQNPDNTETTNRRKTVQLTKAEQSTHKAFKKSSYTNETNRIGTDLFPLKKPKKGTITVQKLAAGKV